MRRLTYNVKVVSIYLCICFISLMYGYSRTLLGISSHSDDRVETLSGCSIQGYDNYRTDQRTVQYIKGTNATTNNIVKWGYSILNNSIYYCNIPKCGSTFMTRFLAQILGIRNYMYGVDSRRMFKIKGNKNISGANKFTFVREPFGRLFAAYENKLYHPNKFWKHLGVSIIKEVRRKSATINNIHGHDVTFLELVQYVVKLHSDGKSLNPHLAPMYTMCDPNRISFDFIGRLETMTDDLGNMTRALRSLGLVSLTDSAAMELESKHKDERYLGRIDHMYRVMKKYKYVSRYKYFLRNWSSYQIRGVILKKYELPFKEKVVDKISKEKYRQYVVTAIENSKQREKELKEQRIEALIQAYKTVPLDLLCKLRELVKPDCQLFNYVEHSEKLFDKFIGDTKSDFDYFKGL